MPDDTQRTDTGFFSRIESWRGLAALMVASAHAWQSPWRDASGQLRSFYVPAPDVDGPFLAALTPVLRIFNNGGGAVNAFFVMSGFVLALSLARGPSELSRSAAKFFPSRLFRIYPNIIATVALFGLVYWMTGYGLADPGAYAFSNILRNMLLLDVSINGVMWSLQVELIGTVVIFLGFVLHARLGSGAVLVLLVLLVALSFAGTAMRMFGPDLTTLYAFVAGMLAYYWGRRLAGSLGRSAIAFAAVFSAMCTVRLVLGFTSNWAVVVEGLLAALVVAWLAFGKLGALGKLFDHPVVRFYGRISYSFYLLHPLSLPVVYHMPDTIGSAVQAGVPTALVAFGLTLVTTLAVTPLAWLAYRFVERPGIRWGRKATDRLLRSHSVASHAST